MARRYRIETPDGKSIEVEGPEDATDEELVGFAREHLNGKFAGNPVAVKGPKSGADNMPVQAKGFGNGLPALFTQGATFGLSDEMSGIAGAAVDAIQAPFTDRIDFDPANSYRKYRDHDRAVLEATRDSMPWTGGAAEFVGGLASLPAKALAGTQSLLAAIKSAPKIGALSGAVSGFGYGEGTDSSIAGAGVGGALGAGLGVAVPIAGSAAGRFFNAGRDFVAPRNGLARGIVARALADDSVTPRTAGAAMQGANDRGVPAMLADQGENLRNLAASVARKPGPSQRLVKEAVEERQAQQGNRIRGAITRDLGPISNPIAESDRLLAQARAASQPLYERAYANPVPATPELEALLSTPAGRAAVSRARTIAANERRDPAIMGFAQDADGNVVLNPAPVAQSDAVSRARSALNTAQSAYRAARMTPAGGNMQSARAAVSQARDGLRAAEAELASAPEAGVAPEVPNYSTQTLDYVKRGLDDIVEANREQSRKLVLDEAGRAVNDVRGSLVREVDKLNPVYAEARAAYSGPASARQAMDYGTKALNLSDQELEEAVKRLSPSDTQHFAAGLRSALADSLERRVDGGDKVQALLGTPRKRKALAQVFGGEENFGRFMQTMADEAQAARTYKRVSTGSMTAENQAVDAVTSDQSFIEDLSGSVIKGATGGVSGFIAELAPRFKDAVKFGAAKTGERTRQEIGALLSETDPTALAEAMRKALRDQALRRVRQHVQMRSAIRGSAYGSRALGGVSGAALRQPED